MSTPLKADVTLLAGILHRQMHISDPLPACNTCTRDASDLLRLDKIRIVHGEAVVDGPDRDFVAEIEAATREEITAELRAANFSLGASLVARGSDDPAGTLQRIRAATIGRADA